MRGVIVGGGLRSLSGPAGLVKPGGLAVIVSPYTWMEEHTPRSAWLGGYRDGNDDAVYSSKTLRRIMDDLGFSLLDEEDMPLLIREHELADSDIDWIHMPMDTVTGWNKGHCFINMRSALKVFDLYRKLDGRKWVTHPAKKRCKVSYARVQCGTPESKLEALDALFASRARLFDATVYDDAALRRRG